MSETETPDYVDVVESTYRTIEHGEHTFEVKEYDSGSLQCPECTRQAKNKSALKQHITHAHNITARIEEECGYRNCDTTYKALDGRNRKFCSQSCASKEHQAERDTDPHTNVCEECGDEFQTPPSHDNIYCSDECYRASSRQTVTCATCGDDFTVPQSKDRTYCSKTCFARRHWKSLEKR